MRKADIKRCQKYSKQTLLSISFIIIINTIIIYIINYTFSKGIHVYFPTFLLFYFL